MIISISLYLNVCDLGFPREAAETGALLLFCTGGGTGTGTDDCTLTHQEKKGVENSLRTRRPCNALKG